jgi:hypothetical protein
MKSTYVIPAAIVVLVIIIGSVFAYTLLSNPRALRYSILDWCRSNIPTTIH